MINLGKISLLAGIFLVVCLVSAGCTSSYNSQKVYTELPTAVQESGSGTAAATPAATQAPAAKSEIEIIKDGLEGIAASWVVSEVKCSGSTCTADLSNENGNTAEIKVIIYSLTDTAGRKFEDEKNEYVGFTLKTPYIPRVDDAFVWTDKAISRGGVIKGNIVAIVDVTIPGGVTISGRETDIIEAEVLLKQVAALI